MMSKAVLATFGIVHAIQVGSSAGAASKEEPTTTKTTVRHVANKRCLNFMMQLI